MELLESLYQRLLLSISQTRPSSDQPLTVGDLYQRLIPYRAIRHELNVLELAEYEHAFLRLLAGEGGYVTVEPSSVTAELQRELASTNPILGIYRDYAEAAVRLNGLTATSRGMAGRNSAPAATGSEGGAPRPAGRLYDIGAAGPGLDATTHGQGEAGTVALSDHAPSGSPDAAPPAEARSGTPPAQAPQPANASPPDLEPLPLIYPSGSSPDAAPAAAESPSRHDPANPVLPEVPSSPTAARQHARAIVAPHRCRACTSELPRSVDARFCPSCGFQQVPHACGRCGSRVEPDWGFCAGCGSSLA